MVSVKMNMSDSFLKTLGIFEFEKSKCEYFDGLLMIDNGKLRGFHLLKPCENGNFALNDDDPDVKDLGAEKFEREPNFHLEDLVVEVFDKVTERRETEDSKTSEIENTADSKKVGDTMNRVKLDGDNNAKSGKASDSIETNTGITSEN